MPKSVRQLVNKALEVMMLLEPGQVVAAEDYETVKGCVVPLLGEIEANGIVSIYVHPTDEDSLNIGDHYFLPLAEALANEAAPSFGLPSATEPARQIIWNRLRRAVARPAHGFVQTAEYF